jgi:hypothetical protein
MKGLVWVAAFAVIVSGCDSGHTGEKEQAAIRTVAATKQGSVSQQFPVEPKSVRCSLNMGGPAPGIRVQGTCATIVDIAPDGSALVRFRETWDGHDFNVNGRVRPGLSHTWDFTLTKAGRNSSARDYGDTYSAP